MMCISRPVQETYRSHLVRISCIPWCGALLRDYDTRCKKTRSTKTRITGNGGRASSSSHKERNERLRERAMSYAIVMSARTIQKNRTCRPRNNDVLPKLSGRRKETNIDLHSIDAPSYPALSLSLSLSLALVTKSTTRLVRSSARTKCCIMASQKNEGKVWIDFSFLSGVLHVYKKKHTGERRDQGGKRD